MLSISDREILLFFVKKNFYKHVRWYAVSIFAMVVVATMTALSAWIMRDVINEIVSRDITRISFVSATVAVIFLIKGIASFIQNYYLSCAGNSIVAEQQRKIYSRLLQHDLYFYDSNHSSQLQVRFIHAAQAVRGVIDTLVTSFIRDSLSLFGLMIVMVIQHPLLSLFSLLVGPLCLLGIRLLVKKVRHLMAQGILALEKIIQTLQDTVVGIRVVKAFAMEEIMCQQMYSAIKEVEDRSNSIAMLESATSPIMETISGLVIAGVIILSGFFIAKQENTPGEIMSFVTALLMAYEPAKRIARTRISLEGGMIGVRFMFNLLNHPIAIKESPHARHMLSGAGKVVFRDVDFSYKKEHPVLAGINICFHAGKTTALIGPSGSGKSTIINLLMRMYDPSSGVIEIDGIDIRDLTFSSLRTCISYVGQDVFLFSGTVRHNILIGRPMATEDELIEVSKAANAHDFIMNLPQGYDTDIGENGNGISGGQKQRIAIARAMLHNGQILVMDEATSALDTHAEFLIRESMMRLMQGRTVIVIAHRISTIAQADHIIVIEKGTVSEEGDPMSLLQKENGSYRKMHSSQILADLL
ncbi:ABC transporter ATP-binding protein [Candidatus Liberibacter sp.]|uniref:ABC transporter ATP-binding protein n=1 Tax=Candidatus Liberibacter sp. TaxID=34022 RepID=UPI002870701C|nr:ABC transporter ATP-binding protein [Candidatus Liberibacter sp.]